MMNYYKLIEFVVFIAIVVTFYAFTVTRLRHERKAALRKFKNNLKQSIHFDVKEVINAEIERSKIVTSCTDTIYAGARMHWKLYKVYEKILELKCYTNKNIDIYYNSSEKCIEVVLGDSIYYIKVLRSLPGRNFLTWLLMGTESHSMLVLSNKSEMIVKSYGAMLIFRMLIRAMLKDFPQKELFDTTTASCERQQEGPA